MAQIKLNQVLTEAQMLKKFGFSKPQLDDLRKKSDFPHVSICKGVTVFIEPYVTNWLLKHQEGLDISDSK